MALGGFQKSWVDSLICHDQISWLPQPNLSSLFDLVTEVSYEFFQRNGMQPSWIKNYSGSAPRALQWWHSSNTHQSLCCGCISAAFICSAGCYPYICWKGSKATCTAGTQHNQGLCQLGYSFPLTPLLCVRCNVRDALMIRVTFFFF